MKQDKFDMGMPVFFKLWFGFVAFLAVCMVAGAVYVVHSTVQFGPDGFGRVIGTFLKSIDDAKR